MSVCVSLFVCECVCVCVSVCVFVEVCPGPSILFAWNFYPKNTLKKMLFASSKRKFRTLSNNTILISWEMRTFRNEALCPGNRSIHSLCVEVLPLRTPSKKMPFAPLKRIFYKLSNVENQISLSWLVGKWEHLEILAWIVKIRVCVCACMCVRACMRIIVQKSSRYFKFVM